ncbi:MAG: HIT domain-containing protein [Candidatus Woesearchaeota archaeon]
MPEMTEEQRKQLEEKIKKMSPEELKEFQKQQCIFCQIVSGKIPSKIVYSDDKCLAVMDINPATKGHVLLLPKEHYAIMPQISDKEIGHLFLVSKYLSQVLLKTLKVSGTNIFVANGAIAGQRAQHFMLHLIPRKEGDKILEIEEKLIDAALRAKVKDLIGPKLNALLGVKKEKQATLPKVELPEKEEKIGKQHKEEEVLDVEAEEVKEQEEQEEVEAEEEQKEEKHQKSTKKTKLKEYGKEKKGKKKSPNVVKVKGVKEKKITVGKEKIIELDDIASLFK